MQLGGVKLDGSELPSRFSTHVLCVYRLGGALNRIFQRRVRPGSLIFAEIHPPVLSKADGNIPLIQASAFETQLMCTKTGVSGGGLKRHLLAAGEAQ